MRKDASFHPVPELVLGFIMNYYRGLRERNVLTSFTCAMMWESFYSATSLREKGKQLSFPVPSATELTVWNAWRAAFKGNAQCVRQSDQAQLV